MSKTRKNNNGIILRWLCLLLAISVGLGYIYYKMNPVIMRYAESVAETIMLTSANRAIVNILGEDNICYGDIVTLNTNGEGAVTSVETDVYKTNYFKSSISNEIAKIISAEERYDVGIPIGSFLLNTYTSGLGPDVVFKMQMTSTAFADFEHIFRSAGINQVLHSIYVNIRVTGSILVAGYRKSINVSTKAMVAETIIVGAVPEAFTNVIESEEDNTAGLINDYGALAGG